MEGEVSKRALESILKPAMLAAKNVRAQRDRLLQLRRRVHQQQRSPGVRAVAADLFEVSSMGLRVSAGYLSACLELAWDNDADLSFANPFFRFVPKEQLYDTLFAQQLPARPATQTDAFRGFEVAYYAVKLASGHHIPGCVEFLVGDRPPSDTGNGEPDDDYMVGYADDMLAAAKDHIFKTHLAGLVKDDIPKTRPKRNRDTPVAASYIPPWTPPQVACGKDPDQALSYLHRACSLASLAVKHIDLAVAFISGFLDPKVVAETAEMADEEAYISEEGPYPSG